MGDPMFAEHTFHCEECGFDARAATDRDLVDALASLGAEFRSALFSFRPGENGSDLVRRRPSPKVWSALEYTAHTRDVLAFYRSRIELVLMKDRPTFELIARITPPDALGYHDEVEVETVEGLAREATALADRLLGLDAEQWRRVGLSSDGSGAERPVRQLVERATHDAHHHLMDIGRSLRAARVG